MTSVNAYSYGANAILIDSRGATPDSLLGGGGARPVAAGYDYDYCAGTKKDGAACTAHPAKGTELCAGHLRSAGRL